MATLLSIAVGAAVTAGGLPMGISAALIAGFAIALMLAHLRAWAVPVWIALGPLAYPFIRYPSGHPVITFDRVWILGMVGWLMTERSNRPTTRSTRLVLVAGAWLVAAIGLRSLTTSGGTRLAVESWVDGLVLPTILFLAARRCASMPGGLTRLVYALSLAGALLGFLGIAQRFGLDLVSRYGVTLRVTSTVGLRVSGPYPDDDMLAISLLICFAATAYLVSDSVGGLRLASAVAAALELGGIYLTFFRGAYVAAGVIVIVVVGLRPGRPGRLFLVGGVLATVAFIAVGNLGQGSGLAQRINDTQNVNGRLATYREGWTIFKSHPLVGVGVNQFASAQDQLLAASVNGVQAADTAHNSYVDVLGEDGLWGMIPFAALTLAVGLVLRALVRNARTRREMLFAASAVAACGAYFLMSMEETTLLGSPENLFLAVVLGAVAAELDVVGWRPRGRYGTAVGSDSG